MADNQQQNDPKRLQTLLSSLNTFNRRYAKTNIRFRIANEGVRTSDGVFHVTNDRVTYLPQLLEQQYKILVAERHMAQCEINKDILADVVNFLTNHDARPSMLLYGPTGTGKTTFMMAMYRTIAFLYQREISMYEVVNIFTKASSLGQILKNDKEQFKRIKAATCLFIDDLGFSGEGEVVNDYGVKAKPMDDIIEYRYDNQLMTCATTNLTEKEILERYGERIFSRICETFSMIPVTGNDYRKLSRK